MAQQIPKFRGGQPLSQQITATSLNRIVDELNSLKIVNVIGGTFKRLPNGTSLHIPWTGGGGGAATEAAFELIDASTESGGVITHKIRTRFGTVNNVTPTNMSAGDNPQLILTATGTEGYVYVESEFTSNVDNTTDIISAEVKISEGVFTQPPVSVANSWTLQVVLGTYSIASNVLSLAQSVGGSLVTSKSGFGFAWGRT